MSRKQKNASRRRVRPRSSPRVPLCECHVREGTPGGEGETALEPPSAIDCILGNTCFIASIFYMSCFELYFRYGKKAGETKITVGSLWVEKAQVRHIPRVAHVLVGLQPVGSPSDYFEDYVGSFHYWNLLVCRQPELTAKAWL